MSQKVNTNIRIDKEIKEKAKKIASEQGTNLSTVLNMYLIDYIETGEMRYKKLNQKVETVKSEGLSDDDLNVLSKMPEFNSLIKTFAWM